MFIFVVPSFPDPVVEVTRYHWAFVADSLLLNYWAFPYQCLWCSFGLWQVEYTRLWNFMLIIEKIMIEFIKKLLQIKIDFFLDFSIWSTVVFISGSKMPCLCGILEEWHRHGEEVLENILRILRGWGNISDVRRRSRRTRRYCLNLEGWGGYFSNTSEPCLCHFHCNLRKINYPLFHNGGYWSIYPLLPRGGIDQYTPSRQ